MLTHRGAANVSDQPPAKSVIGKFGRSFRKARRSQLVGATPSDLDHFFEVVLMGDREDGMGFLRSRRLTSGDAGRLARVVA